MTQQILSFLYSVPAILFAISIHEFSHGYVAYKLGDPTASNQGRLTLNPMKHFDLIGFIAMLLVHVGWAKPVPVNIRYFKNVRRDSALVGIAGPASNIISAIVFAIIYLGFLKIVSIYQFDMRYEVLFGIISILQNFIFLNVGLCIFNLLPIPPLDGSRILDSFLPPKALIAYHRYERHISIIMFLLIVTGVVSPFISKAIYAVADVIFKIAGFVVRI